MTFQEIREFHRSHWRRPWVLAAILGLAASDFLGAGSILLPGAFLTPLKLPAYLAIILALHAGIVWAAPWPWLWDGREGGRPGRLRGLAQALLAGLLLYLPMSALLWAEARLGPGLWTGLGFPGFLRHIAPFHLILYLFTGYVLVQHALAAEARREAQATAAQAQWILLQGHMNPHVFFNAMNNLTALIAEDPRAARQAALDLKDLFARLGRQGERPWETLGAERALLEDTLRIEALRLGARLRVAWDWDPALERALVPPLLVQPLVENAIKHGIAAHPAGGGLRIIAARHGGRIRILVANTGRPLGARREGGSGLDNLEARLRLVYGEAASFRLEAQGEATLARLDLPWRGEEAP